MRETEGLAWFKSSYSNGEGACVETAAVVGTNFVRDSKQLDGPILRFPAEEWSTFVNSVKDDKVSV
ncbi:DUF397 domain-containing protein [Streptomyces sp. MI02-2A]|uniref:DUF397 domain-containing protein n=1 Tax=Streptomyces sp. MI02-2A TaxID=3028688 RepID=UPI0029B8665C|nr:DUF397 domain-containing protein [Streptomyces sp. MI02-2A]MDX3260814.1 DUF397 domain-containing protein [Streptomyces sp. MI02-2A]